MFLALKPVRLHEGARPRAKHGSPVKSQDTAMPMPVGEAKYSVLLDVSKQIPRMKGDIPGHLKLTSLKLSGTFLKCNKHAIIYTAMP